MKFKMLINNLLLDFMSRGLGQCYNAVNVRKYPTFLTAMS